MSSPRGVGSFRGPNPAENSLLDGHTLEEHVDCHDDIDVSQVEDTQFTGLEIDTQVTNAYDEGDLPIQSAAPKSFAMPPEENDLNVATGFSYGKAVIKRADIAIQKRPGERAAGPIKEVKQASPATSRDSRVSTLPEKSLQTMQSAASTVEISTGRTVQVSPPRPMRRTALASTDPNFQLSMNINSRPENGGPKPASATATKAERSHPAASDPVVAAQPLEPMVPPFTQVVQQMPVSKNVRRKKTAPAALQHNDYAPESRRLTQTHNQGVEVAGTMGSNAHRQYQRISHEESGDVNQLQANTPNMSLNVSFSLPASDGEELTSVAVRKTASMRRAAHDGHSVVASPAKPPGHAAEVHKPRNGSPERFSMADGDEPMSRPAQSRPRTQGIASLPFPEAAIPSTRRSSPTVGNRPLASMDLQLKTSREPRPSASSGRVTKRKKSAVDVRSNGTYGEPSVPSQAVPGRQNAMLQHGNPIHGIMPQGHESAADMGDDVEEAIQQPAIIHHRPALRTVSNPNVSPLDLFDQAKNMLTEQVLEKDRELGRLQAEVSKLILTVQGLKGDVSQLEQDKAKLQGDMHKKCESLKEKVSELLKDHKAVGGFIEKTNRDIAKFNKYRENSGSVFKEAIVKYGDLQQHQKRMTDAIHEARVHVANDVANLTKAHSHESGVVLKDLQAEKKKVLELEKIIDAEKQKVMHLETRLDFWLQDNTKSMLKEHSESFAAKVKNQGKELLEAIGTCQEEKTASLKDYLKTLQTYKEHESDASKSFEELLGLVTALSASVSEALKSKDAAHDGLQKVGTEIMNSIKEKVESISKAQGNQAELANRVLHLETSKINLESHLKSETQSKLDLQSQLEGKSLELQQQNEQILHKNQELEALRSTLHQGTARNEQEANGLRLSLATANDELRQLNEFQVKLDEDNQALQAQNSRMEEECESAAEGLRRLQEDTQQVVDRLKASEDDKSRYMNLVKAADAKVVEMEARLAEQTAAAKQQLDAQRIQMQEERRRAVTLGQQGALSELSCLKKGYDKLAAEKIALENTIASHTDSSALEAENVRLQLEKSTILRRHTSHVGRYRDVVQFQTQEIGRLETEMGEVRELGLRQAEQLRQIESFEQRLEIGLAGMERRLSHQENIEMNVRSYCEKRKLNYEYTNFEEFLHQMTANAVDDYRQSLNSSSFSAQFPRPSLSFGQSMIAAATAGSPAFESQFPAAARQSERPNEIVQVPATQTPRRGHRSPSMPSMVSRSPRFAMVSPPKARRNHSIAERRRALASSVKLSTPDTSGTPVRKPTDRTTGSGGKGILRPNAPAPASSMFDVPNSSQEASQPLTAAPRKADRHAAQTLTTPKRSSGGANGRPDSDFSDLTEIMDMMDQNPEVDVIPVLEQQRRERASSTVEDSQSQPSRASAMDPPATPRVQPPQEPKPLRSILKKRTLSVAQEVEETAIEAQPRKQLQPLKGKNSLASLGTGMVRFGSSQDAGPSQAFGVQAREETANSSIVKSEVDGGKPAIIGPQRGLKRTKTMRSLAGESVAQATAPAAKKARMSIPYKAASRPSASQRN